MRVVRAVACLRRPLLRNEHDQAAAGRADEHLTGYGTIVSKKFKVKKPYGV